MSMAAYQIGERGVLFLPPSGSSLSNGMLRLMLVLELVPVLLKSRWRQVQVLGNFYEIDTAIRGLLAKG